MTGAQGAAMGICTIDECFRPSARDGLCWTHHKRRKQGRPMAAPVLATGRGSNTIRPRERVVEAVNDIADCGDDDAEFLASMHRLARAAAKWPEVRGLIERELKRGGWRPPG